MEFAVESPAFSNTNKEQKTTNANSTIVYLRVLINRNSFTYFHSLFANNPK